MRRFSVFLLLTMCLLTTSTAAQGLADGCRILYLDTHSERLTLFSPATGKTQVIETGYAPFIGNAIVSVYALAPDHRKIAVSLMDTGVTTDQTPDRYGTKVFDLAESGASLADTILFWWPYAWSHRSDKLLLWSIGAAHGTYAIYDFQARSILPVTQSINPNTDSDGVPLGVWAIEWSLDDRYLAFDANEVPFPQDEFGSNSGVYVTTPGGPPIRLTERQANATLIGWLPDDQLVFAACKENHCQLVASTPNGQKRQVLYETPSNSLRVYSLSPQGERLVLGWDMPQERGTTLVILDLKTKQATALDHVAYGYGDANWSPDGHYFTYRATIDDASRLFLVNVADSKPIQIDYPAGDHEGLGDWSPDSTELLLDSGTGDQQQILILEVARRTLTPVKLPDQHDFSPYYSLSWVCASGQR